MKSSLETFKHEHKIKIMYSPALVNKAPSYWKKGDWAKFYGTFRQVELTPYKMAGLIWQGYSFTPVWKNGRRLESNFVEAWHVGFDFDAHGADLDYLMREGTFCDYFASFAYATPSSTEDHPKSRVVFVFDEPVTDPDYYRQLYQAIAWRIEQNGSYTDPVCKDPLRLYYGSEKAEMRGNWRVIPKKTMTGDCFWDMLIAEYEAAHPEPEQPVLALPKKIVDNPSEKWQQAMILALADNIAKAPDGERHMARRNNARTAGGYVASGSLPEGDVLHALVMAARYNTDDPDAAERTVRDGVEYGKKSPLYPEMVDRAMPATAPKTIDQRYKTQPAGARI